MERGSQGNLNPKSPTLRDKNASFSSHHRPDDHCGCRADLDHDSTSDLSIFNAHKYFNEVTINNNNNRVSPLLNMDQHKQNPEAEKDNDITNTSRSYSYSYSSSSPAGGYANIKNCKTHSFHAATPTPPSSSSKASWNSQVGLLSHPPTNAISVTTRNSSHNSDLRKKIRASLLKPIWLLRRKCPCSDKKSVQVKENTPKPKTSVTTTSPTHQSLSHNQIPTDSVNHKTQESDHKAVNSQRFQFQPLINQVRRPLSEGFTFPLFLATTTSPTKQQVVLNVVQEEEPSRDSLQVFQPPSPPKSRVMEDDAASDASSDLFEIESFSTQATTFTYPMRECHEPITEATTIHNFFSSNPSSTLWWQQQRDAMVPPPLPMI